MRKIKTDSDLYRLRISGKHDEDCSIVTATYELEEGVQGTIGIIGPKRMDYKKVVGNLQTMMNQLDDIFKKK